MPTYTIPNEQPTEDPGYIQSMVDKAEGVTSSEELIAGKFKTQEELHKSLIELIKKQHGDDLTNYYKSIESSIGKPQETTEQKAQEAPESTTPETPTSEETPKPNEAKSIVEAAGLTYDQLEKELLEFNGKLSDDSYKKLETVGVDREMIDGYIAGQTALFERRNAEIYSTVGGQEAYMKMLSWAQTGLSQDEIKAFNATIDDGDTGKIKLAVLGLKAKYELVYGRDTKEPNLVTGNATSAGTAGYMSKAEMTRDMADPRYDKDPAFREMVIQRIRASKVL